MLPLNSLVHHYRNSNSKSAMASELGCLLRQTLIFLFLMAALPANMNSLSFNFPDFSQNKDSLDIQDSASFSSSELQLTPRNQTTGDLTSVDGRALYKTAVLLWDARTKKMTDFSTSFKFRIDSYTYFVGDGLAFILVPTNIQFISGVNGAAQNISTVGGGTLGIYPFNTTAVANYSFAYNTKAVAVEFDTYQNPWDPSETHIGIDVNQVMSTAYVNVSDGLVNKTSQASISYNSTTKNLSVSLSVSDTSVLYSVSHIIDLSTVLPERIHVGFSAGTGSGAELHNILSWSFNSTLEETAATSPAQPPQQGGTPGTGSTKKSNGGLIAGITAGICLILVIGVAIAWIRLRRNSPSESNTQFDFGEDFVAQAGPKGFAYAELSKATNNFAIERKLGEGASGGVYKGILTGPGSREIAVKKIKSKSDRGQKEYVAEVKIISRLRHRNLVQLLGWCHDHGELLLVYEFMPNGSLDAHLFSHKLALLSWSTRYKIALGLASSLLYLHEEWEQSVVHRDIKSSNVMLDLSFNPKLGDFGLARLVDHDAGMQTTALAGTPGYMAPECLLTGKASKESDVYSFGIVALEIACGRRVIEVREHPSKVNLVEWVWDLYGKGLILEAVDNSLEGEFEEEQAKRLMVVGLWCSHPDIGHRPSIRQAIAALNDETPLPSLPSHLPVPIYVSSPGMNMSHFSSYTSSNTTEGNYPHTSSSTTTTATTSSSQQSGKSPSAYPLLRYE